MRLRPYDRAAAVAYAHKWAYGRNPAFYDYENIGGVHRQHLGYLQTLEDGIQRRFRQFQIRLHVLDDLVSIGIPPANRRQNTNIQKSTLQLNIHIYLLSCNTSYHEVSILSTVSCKSSPKFLFLRLEFARY